MTFSIIARCSTTGQFGAAISSSSPAVASRCIRALPGVGVVASQNITDPNLGKVLLDLMKYDLTPKQALTELKNEFDFLEYRQLALINSNDPPAVFSGSKTLGVFNSSAGKDAMCVGNLLANKNVTEQMLKAFESSEGSLTDRLLTAMEAGLEEGGEAGPVHSAGVLVVDKASWPVVDLRVDWEDLNPIKKLNEIWEIYEPQMADYVQRAVNPTSAPSYGVPGDL